MDKIKEDAYAKKYQTDGIWLMYPITDEFTDTEQIEFQSNDGVNVKIYLLIVMTLKVI